MTSTPALCCPHHVFKRQKTQHCGPCNTTQCVLPPTPSASPPYCRHSAAAAASWPSLACACAATWTGSPLALAAAGCGPAPLVFVAAAAGAGAAATARLLLLLARLLVVGAAASDPACPLPHHRLNHCQHAAAAASAPAFAERQVYKTEVGNTDAVLGCGSTLLLERWLEADMTPTSSTCCVLTLNTQSQYTPG